MKEKMKIAGLVGMGIVCFCMVFIARVLDPAYIAIAALASGLCIAAALYLYLKAMEASKSIISAKEMESIARHFAGLEVTISQSCGDKLSDKLMHVQEEVQGLRTDQKELLERCITSLRQELQCGAAENKALRLGMEDIHRFLSVYLEDTRVLFAGLLNKQNIEHEKIIEKICAYAENEKSMLSAYRQTVLQEQKKLNDKFMETLGQNREENIAMREKLEEVMEDAVQRFTKEFVKNAKALRADIEDLIQTVEKQQRALQAFVKEEQQMQFQFKEEVELMKKQFMEINEKDIEVMEKMLQYEA